MELYQLRSFVAVASFGHLTRAAERLHLSQPALSAQIKALEEEFGLELFERKPSGMVPTAAGRRLVTEAEKLLSAALAFRNEARAIQGELAGVARVGTVSDPEFIRIGEFLSSTVERYPLVELQFHHEVSGAAFENVRDGVLDASFYYGDLSHSSVAGLELREITYRIVGPAAWEARLAAVDWKDIASEPWIMTPPISTHFQLANALFEHHGVGPAKVVEADDEVVTASLVVSGLGMALMREDLAFEKARAGQIFLWRDVRLTTKLQFVYLREREQDPVIRAMLDVLTDVWDRRPAKQQRRAQPRRRNAAADISVDSRAA